MKNQFRAAITAGLLVATATAHSATITSFSDKPAFLSATGATNATGPIPSLGNVSTNPVTVGSVTFVSDPNGLWFGVEFEPEVDWTTLLPGHEIAINNLENMDVSFAVPVFSYGFDFVEPEFSTPNINAPFVDSLFTVSLFNGASPVGAFTFNAPNDVAAFVGVWSDMLFDRAEIRETSGGTENEFFGEVYTGLTPLGQTPVPEPTTLTIFAFGLVGLGFVRRRRAALSGAWA